jgi:hypothetical protein
MFSIFRKIINWLLSHIRHKSKQETYSICKECECKIYKNMIWHFCNDRVVTTIE